MDDEDVVDKVLLAWLLCLIGAGCLIALLVGLSGCTAAERQTAISSGTKAAILSADVAACVQGALARQQIEELRQQREAEAEAAIEADRLRSEMHAPSSVSQEVDKLVRPDAGAM